MVLNTLLASDPSSSNLQFIASLVVPQFKSLKQSRGILRAGIQMKERIAMIVSSESEQPSGFFVQISYDTRHTLAVALFESNER